MLNTLRTKYSKNYIKFYKIFRTVLQIYHCLSKSKKLLEILQQYSKINFLVYLA